MLILITGVPGAGKTLYSIGLLKQYLAESRPVYTDIEGIKLEGVLPAPDDWREVPDGSVVCYDEVQRKFPADGKGGRTDRPDIAEIETHRHRGIDLLFITQHPNLIHSHVRRLVGRHYHVFRLYGATAAKVFSMDRIMRTDSKTELQQAESVAWQYPKKDFALYKSATVHTHKFRIPRYIKVAAVMMALVAGFVYWGFNSSAVFAPIRGESLVNDAASDAGAAAAYRGPITVQTPAYSFDSAAPRTELSGCMATDTVCRCFDMDYRPVGMTDAACRNQLLEPIWRPAQPKGGSSRPAPTTAAANVNKPLGEGPLLQ